MGMFFEGDVPNGTRVRYHGSIKTLHGLVMSVEGAHKELQDTAGEYSPVRYILVYGPEWRDFLSNVRPESFTPIDEEKLKEMGIDNG